MKLGGLSAVSGASAPLAVPNLVDEPARRAVVPSTEEKELAAR
jgi:hypothetical protein